MGTMCTCEEIERGTHACKASKLGLVERWWTQDGKLGITIQDPPQSPEDGHIYCILLIRIAFYHVSKNLPLHCLFDVTISISVFYINIARDVVTDLLIFVDIYHFNYTFSHAHVDAHIHKHTYMISTQDKCRQPGIRAWLGGAEDRVLLETKA